jgi:hypothetical protein
MRAPGESKFQHSPRRARLHSDESFRSDDGSQQSPRRYRSKSGSAEGWGSLVAEAAAASIDDLFDQGARNRERGAH